ncbi:MAG: hypothetical protein JWL70_1897 [Acidimicrobiia bacterium]|nr:hypothetical protein [Acidimicrobiia bacterium]
MDSFDASVYGSAIADEYDGLYAGYWDTDSAVACLAALAGDGPLLEFGIGTGRLAIPLAQQGLEVHGIDGSAEMVQRLIENHSGPEIPVAIGDFSTADVGRRFALVLLAVNTIFALPDQQAQVRCFANAARHLLPGGRFVVEAWLPDLAAFQRPRLVRPRILNADRISIEVVELDPVNQMMRTTQAVFRDGSVRLYPANHRYAWPAEMDLMAQLAGFELEDRWSNWQREPFTATSTNHVSVYRLPSS